jgi:hypothetical protein
LAFGFSEVCTILFLFWVYLLASTRAWNLSSRLIAKVY